MLVQMQNKQEQPQEQPQPNITRDECQPISLAKLPWSDAMAVMIQNTFKTKVSPKSIHNMLITYVNKKRLSNFYYNNRKKNGFLTKKFQTHFENYIRCHHKFFFEKLCQLCGGST